MENSRICKRLKTLNSSIKYSKICKDYQKSKKIKDNIMRYAVEDEKIILKS